MCGAMSETMSMTVCQPRAVTDLTAELLELFSPIHYKGGMTLADAMCGRQFTRKQVAILKRKSGAAFNSCDERSRPVRRRDS